MSALEMICPECQTVIDGAGDGMIYVMICPNCHRKGKTIGLVSSDRYDVEKRQEELDKRMCCRNCNYIGLIEEFPFNPPPNDNGRQRRCHRCHSADVVSMAEVTMCATCDEAPAVKNDTVCAYCRDQEILATIDAVANIPMCENCGKNWAVEGDEWCRRCIDAQSERKRKPKRSLW